MTAPAAQEPLERILDLNVGGVHYTVSRDTLLRLPNTMLEAMFSGRHQQQKHEGRYFIDRWVPRSPTEPAGPCLF